jgi:hypothetical protein
MTGTQLAILLGIGVPSLILAIAAVVGAVREYLSRDADPGPLRPLFKGWFSRLDIGSVGDRIAELRFRISDRGRQDRADRIGRRPQP